jgi:hypothetical protein
MIAVVGVSEFRLSRNERVDRYDVHRDGAFYLSSVGSADCISMLQFIFKEKYEKNPEQCPEIVWRNEVDVLAERAKAKAEAERVAAEAAKKVEDEKARINAEQAPV